MSATTHVVVEPGAGRLHEVNLTSLVILTGRALMMTVLGYCFWLIIAYGSGLDIQPAVETGRSRSLP